MRILGHPIHIMLIHFPSALLPMELVCYILLFATGTKSFGPASYYAMVGGVVMGWMAVITGAIDLINIPPSQPTIRLKALIHGTINSFVLVIYTVLAYLASKQYPGIPEASVLLLIIKSCLVIVLIAGNYKGGELILKHKVAIDH